MFLFVINNFETAFKVAQHYSVELRKKILPPLHFFTKSLKYYMWIHKKKRFHQHLESGPTDKIYVDYFNVARR